MIKYLKVGIISMTISKLSGVFSLSLTSGQYWYDSTLITLSVLIIINYLEDIRSKNESNNAR